MKLVSLSKGEFAIVDDEDFENLNQHIWSLGGHGNFKYGRSYLNGKDNKRCRNRVEKLPCQRMHRVILGLPPGREKIVDHINGNGLDNRKENLRITDFCGNNRNRKPLKGKSSQYKGVCFSKRDKNWSVSIKINNKPIKVQGIKSELSAAVIYDCLAAKYFGEHAYYNFPG